jgi:hypothetical protein
MVSDMAFLPAPAPAPILVLSGPGMPGATLAAALGRNPGAFGLPALNLALEPTLDRYLDTLSGLRAGQMHGLLRLLALRLGGEQTIAAVAMARRWLMLRAHLPADRILHEIAALFVPRCIVLPVTTELFDPGAAERLARTWDNAILVQACIRPHNHATLLMAEAGGAAAVLLGAVRQRGEGPLEPDPESLWLMTDKAVETFAALSGRPVIPQRIEDLLADPAAELGRLARRLGLPDDADAIAAMSAPQDSPFAGPGPFGAHLPAGISGLGPLRDSLAAASGSTPRPPTPRPEVRDRLRAQGYA